jgi:large subunit ribosomal protein MRP49
LLSFEPAPPTLAPNLQEAIRPGGGILPTHGQQRQSRPDPNTYEHRLLKRTINLLLRRVQRFAAVANQEAERLGTNRRVAEMQRMAEGCAIADARLRELRSLPFLRDVAELDAFRGPTPLMQREAAYREVYRTWLALRREPLLAADAPFFRIPIAELPRLYELWCVLQVALVLASAAGWQIDQQDLIGEQEDGEPLLRIEPGDLLQIRQQEWTIVLRYQPRYRPLQSAADRHLGSLDRHTRVPDIALEAHGPNNALHVLIIDAKYRLDSDGRHVPQDALAEAYAYRGAIGRLGQTCADAAWIVYPASTPAEHYLSQVGTIPLLPGSPNLLADRITTWLATLGNV